MDIKEKHQHLRSKYSDEEYIERLEKENKKLREGLALNQGDVARKKMLLEELGQAVSDEIVDKENGNYLKLKVDDIPEDFVNYIAKQNNYRQGLAITPMERM
jgi:predicted nuclease with TOPRIM domain